MNNQRVRNNRGDSFRKVCIAYSKTYFTLRIVNNTRLYVKPSLHCHFRNRSFAGREAQLIVQTTHRLMSKSSLAVQKIICLC